MLVDLVFYAIGMILKMVLIPFQALSWAIPNEILEAIIDAVGYTRYFQGIFPMETVWLIVSIFFTFLTILFTVDIVLFVGRLTGKVGNVDIKK